MKVRFIPFSFSILYFSAAFAESLGSTNEQPVAYSAQSAAYTAQSAAKPAAAARAPASASRAPASAAVAPGKKESNCSVFKSGQASVYGTNNGSGDSSKQGVAGGGKLNVRANTAAMHGIPFGTRVEVTNKRTNKTLIVTINDRGPYATDKKGKALKPLRPHATRVIDLTPTAARNLGISGLGSVVVKKCRGL